MSIVIFHFHQWLSVAFDGMGMGIGEPVSSYAMYYYYSCRCIEQLKRCDTILRERERERERMGLKTCEIALRERKRERLSERGYKF